jgi:fatty acid desaturase
MSDKLARKWLLSSEQRSEMVARHPPIPWIYWLDLLASSALAWALFIISYQLPFGSPQYVVTTLIDMFVFLRVGYFMHELAHRSERELPGFSLVWNLLVGIPILLPSMMMMAHMDHHRTRAYGTERDPEYAPIAAWTRTRMVQSVLGFGMVPLLLPIRFALLAPISFLHPKLRSHLVRKFSTVDINAGYNRPAPKGAELTAWRWQEFACFTFSWAALIATGLGWLGIYIHIHRFVVMSGSLMLNQWRTLVIHRYQGDGEPMAGSSQVHDTVTFAGHALLSGLIAPLGSRFHALHHELPSVPYHALPTIHQELLRDDEYQRTLSPGVIHTWLRVWSERAQERRRRSPST